jgi:hypothetical protein
MMRLGIVFLFITVSIATVLFIIATRIKKNKMHVDFLPKVGNSGPHDIKLSSKGIRIRNFF